MIDRCDPEIATWSITGDNFIVKNVEKFASTVLPLYFKHSNFSSFARQLNFYGFRKLRSDPILTNDVDPQTACYVRFYHEKFQKNKPELLHSIKRATKSDQQSKDDVDDLKSQVFKLKKCVLDMSTQMEHKISEINFEYNRRISGLTAEYEKLASLVGQLLQPQQHLQHQVMQSSKQQQLPPNSAPLPPPQCTHYVPNTPLPFTVESNTTALNVSTSNTASVNTTITDVTAPLTPLSSTTSATSAAPHSLGKPMTLEPQHKLQSHSQVITMSLIGAPSTTGTTEIATTSAKVTSISTPTDGEKTAGKRGAPESVRSSEVEPSPAVRPKIK